jgi:hypothetical protein
MGWYFIAYEWFGSTTLPMYGPTLTKEYTLILITLYMHWSGLTK